MARRSFDRFQAHLGAGARLLRSPRVDVLEGGFDGRLSLEAYPASPLALRAIANIGNAGSALFADVRGALGLLWQRFESFAGYGAMWIGRVRFHGPFAGLHVHL